MKKIITSRGVVYPALFVIALAAFTLGLRNREILMIDTRFALFCHELLERGGAPFPCARHSGFSSEPYRCVIVWLNQPPLKHNLAPR